MLSVPHPQANGQTVFPVVHSASIICFTPTMG